jgi:hypothetical protein
MGIRGSRARRGRAWGTTGRAGAVACAALALALSGCAGGTHDGGGGGRGIGDAIEAKSTVRAVTQTAFAALDRLTVDGQLANVTVNGLSGTATVNGRVIHTQSTTGFSTEDSIDALVTVAFTDFRTAIPNGGEATATGTVDLLLGIATPGGGAGPEPFPGHDPIEVSGNVAFAWHGFGLTGNSTDSFTFAATGPSVDGLSGTMTTLGGVTYPY